MHVQIDLHDLYHYRSLLHVRHRIKVQVFLNHSLSKMTQIPPAYNVLCGSELIYTCMSCICR